MKNNPHIFLPEQEVTPYKIIRTQVIFILIMIALGLFNWVIYHKSIVALMITVLVLLIGEITVLNIKNANRITIDFGKNTFTADYLNAFGKNKTMTFDLYKSSINYKYQLSKSGGYWELAIHENIINKQFKVRVSEKGYSKKQTDEMYSIMQSFQENNT